MLGGNGCGRVKAVAVAAASSQGGGGVVAGGWSSLSLLWRSCVRTCLPGKVSIGPLLGSQVPPRPQRIPIYFNLEKMGYIRLFLPCPFFVGKFSPYLILLLGRNA